MSHTTITLMILAGSLGMIILALSIIVFVFLYQKKVLAQQNLAREAENKHQRELLEATIQVEEKERERIAKNIHDDVGTMLNVIKLNLTKISRNSNDGQLVNELMKDNLKLLEESIQGIRGIARDLAPPTLRKLGYAKGINELCRHINNSGKIAVEFVNEGEGLKLPTATELQLYRITQEVITNIVKHTRASKIKLHLAGNQKNVSLLIAHDGEGITSEKIYRLTEEHRGIGLKSIQSRAQMIKASIQYFTVGQSEARITIEIPLHEEKEN
ncbi:MAG: hypothetical protein IAF38_22220 [Bacteroidia bacterium]|nr:hypothetical protein [Bacteroidia bacterium]